MNTNRDDRCCAYLVVHLDFGRKMMSQPNMMMAMVPNVDADLAMDYVSLDWNDFRTYDAESLMSLVTFHTNLVIVRGNFALSPFVVRPNNHAVDASLDDDHGLEHPTNDYCTDRFVEHQDFAADALAAVDVDFELVDVANGLVVALSFEFVALEMNLDLFFVLKKLNIFQYAGEIAIYLLPG